MPRFRQIEPEAEFPYVFCALTSDGSADFGSRVLMASNAKAWCCEQFGRTRPAWTDAVSGPPRWRLTSTRAKFMNAADATAFKIRWC